MKTFKTKEQIKKLMTPDNDIIIDNDVIINFPYEEIRDIFCWDLLLKKKFKCRDIHCLNVIGEKEVCYRKLFVNNSSFRKQPDPYEKGQQK